MKYSDKLKKYVGRRGDLSSPNSDNTLFEFRLRDDGNYLDMIQEVGDGYVEIRQGKVNVITIIPLNLFALRIDFHITKG